MSIRVIRLPYVPRGGIAESTFTSAGGILVGTGASSYTEVAPASLTAGHVPTLQGDGTVAWQAQSGGGGGGVTDHGDLTGLSDDDHTQYHTDARALTWLSTRSTTDLAEGTNLYYTDARADTRAGIALASHEGEADPHPGYVLESREGVADGVATLDAGGDVPLAQLGNVPAAPVTSVNGATGVVVLDATDVGADATGTASTAVSAHEGAADPHPGYILESREGAASGVATLDATTRIPRAQIASGTPSTGQVPTVQGDGSLAYVTPSGGGGGAPACAQYSMNPSSPIFIDPGPITIPYDTVDEADASLTLAAGVFTATAAMTRLVVLSGTLGAGFSGSGNPTLELSLEVDSGSGFVVLPRSDFIAFVQKTERQVYSAAIRVVLASGDQLRVRIVRTDAGAVFGRLVDGDTQRIQFLEVT